MTFKPGDRVEPTGKRGQYGTLIGLPYGRSEGLALVKWDGWEYPSSIDTRDLLLVLEKTDSCEGGDKA